MARELGFEVGDTGLQGLDLVEQDEHDRPDGGRRRGPVRGRNSEGWHEIRHGGIMKQPRSRVKLPERSNAGCSERLNGYGLRDPTVLTQNLIFLEPSTAT